MICLLAFCCMQAENYFTMGIHDTVTIYPDEVINFDSLAVHANFDGRLDEWHLSITYPSGMNAIRVNRRVGMYLPYMDISQNASVLEAPLTTDYNYTTISSIIQDYGYYDYNGVWTPYGTVKWEGGYYGRMFDIGFSLASNFAGGTITITGTVDSSIDLRGGTIYTVDNTNTSFIRYVTVIVGYYRGDVDGNGVLNMDDVTLLIAYLTDDVNNPLDAYQLAAADVNLNGSISITDVTALVAILLES